ncbi:hypothetical protein ICN48_03040 [Polynucleobacter sp. JS-Safj-400b-B2]|uniref:hypothetical protein n=1 Tax=Polynucleobacter sp. JS-Safj-400b-B2 TaxID=2576921 RepID=UPI001C0CBC17|nr:hypothetical protein [Polynucleobacter sp. JS-Safj-400b-B2]MBU3625220.1 hypothetical protein [Polynucleobacter sp. JS-Safj-400b-B2]
MFKLFKISSEWFIECAISAMAYTLLFYFNSWLTNSIAFGLGVSWIYLPAGLRLFLTLIFGLPGAIGIAVASFLISYHGDFSQDVTVCIGVGIISGFVPYLARYFAFRNIRLESDLSNLNFPKLIACILTFSLLSAGFHQWRFSMMTLEDAGSLNHFVVMFIGDVLGSFLLIALIKYCLDLVRKIRKTAH